MKDALLKQVESDLFRAKEALDSAERNLKEGDILTTANRTFVACENSVYVMLKLTFGSTSINRNKILTKLKEISPDAKKCYDDSYDLRVQADYGRVAQKMELNEKNIKNIFEKVKSLVQDAEKSFKGTHLSEDEKK